MPGFDFSEEMHGRRHCAKYLFPIPQLDSGFLGGIEDSVLMLILISSIDDLANLGNHAPFGHFIKFLFNLDFNCFSVANSMSRFQIGYTYRSKRKLSYLAINFQVAHCTK